MRKRNRGSLSCVYFFHKTRNLAVSRSSRATTATKRRVPLSSLLETATAAKTPFIKKMAFFKLSRVYDFLETALKFKKRKKISPSLVYVLHNKMKLGISTS